MTLFQGSKQVFELCNADVWHVSFLLKKNSNETNSELMNTMKQQASATNGSKSFVAEDGTKVAFKRISFKLAILLQFLSLALEIEMFQSS